MVTDPPYGIELDSEWCDRAGLNKHGPAEASYMKQRTEGHTNTSISSDTRADWFEAFALVPSLQVAYVWHASKFTSEVLAGLLITAYGSRFLAQEIRHEGPTFLPDGNHFLYLRVSSVAASSGLYVGSLDARAEEQSSGRVLATESAASYVPPADREPGRLLFVREGALLAQSFDLGRLQLAGEPELAAEAVGIVGSRGLFSASTNGVLIYRAGETQNLQLTWFDRRGKVLGTAGEPGRYFNLSLSPNGTTAAKGNGRQTLPGWSLDRYSSNESGKDEVYVQGFVPSADAGALAAGGKWMVSRGESRGMVYWRADGRELYFLTTDLARGCDPRRPALPLCDPRAARSSRSS